MRNEGPGAPSTAFVDVYRPASHAELAVVRMALEADGIQYCVKNQVASMSVRAATGADELSVMVRPDQADAARPAITEALGA
ncbi:MAG TPA: DUF2007 domain-containing protein [Gemmatimonadales bacterium]|jgi:hypothetical protein